uniref:Reverse transcriptase domain-containing protein n=1 Tax=Tanacetum cinerariifolium TaxID=118510 RepID=A0A6L2MY77_TANCI|nr:hypothetical protein [Tanacetum cinerariifolium]
MEPKVTLSSCLDLDEQDMQQMLKRTKILKDNRRKVNTSKALDASLVDIESSGTESKEQDTSSRSRNDSHADDADIRPIYDEDPMAEFAKLSILGKSVLQPHRNQAVVRQPTAFKFKRPRLSKPRFSSQVDVNNDLPKPVTTHYFPRQKEYAFAKLHQMIAPSSSSSKLRIHKHNNEPSSLKLVPKVVPLADTTALSKQELDHLFGPLYDEFFNAGTSSVNKSSSPTDNSKQQDTPPSTTA